MHHFNLKTNGSKSFQCCEWVPECGGGQRGRMNLERLRFPSVDGPAWGSQHGCLADTSAHSLMCHRAPERRTPTEKPQHRNSCIFQGQKSRRTQLSSGRAHTGRPGARLIRTPGTEEAKTHSGAAFEPERARTQRHTYAESIASFTVDFLETRRKTRD